MKLTPAAAITLRLTDLKLYNSPYAVEYLSRLDLSSADDIIARLSPDVRSYMEQLMTSRKYYLRKEAFDFLEACSAAGKTGQLILLGAGNSPLAIHLAENFPQSMVWDIAMNLSPEKSAFSGSLLPHLHLIDCVVTNDEEWADRLHFTGFDPTQPSLFVLENLYFYISSQEMRGIICRARQLNGILSGDFMLNQASVSDLARTALRATFDALKGNADFGSMRFYSRLEFASLLDVCGYRDIRFQPISRIQLQRTGSPAPFETENGSPIEMWSVR
ncbi:MAG: hypothetical protein RL021_1620 [Bacteroidota bacterium]|jgi:hypothetical protein